jgi:hypothetical protein
MVPADVGPLETNITGIATDGQVEAIAQNYIDGMTCCHTIETVLKLVHEHIQNN